MSDDSDMFTGSHDFSSWGYNWIVGDKEEEEEKEKERGEEQGEDDSALMKQQNLILLTKLTSNCKNADQVKSTVVKFAIKKILKIAIKRYCIKENLPLKFIELPRSSDALYQIILQHLKLMNLIITYEYILKFQNLSEMLVDNLNGLTIYDRVSVIQGEIHSFAEKVGGAGSTKLLDKSTMRQLLSTCRLSLSVQDLSNKPPEYIVEQLRRNNDSVNVEKLLSGKNGLKGTIKNWKVRHLRSLLWYAPESARE